jgi:hypothetical protein
MDQVERQAFDALDPDELAALRGALKGIIDAAR